MKKIIFAVAIALFAMLQASAQEPRGTIIKTDSIRWDQFTLPDSLMLHTPWRPNYKTMEYLSSKPVVSMTSVVVVQQKDLPARITVLNNNTLRMGGHFNLSNGQAWNNSPFPDAYLDARTLSFPGRR